MDTLIHDLQDITIRRISVSEMDNNVYLLTGKASGAQLLIDAADDLAAIQGLLADAARHLEASGADFVVICANLMHKVADDVQAAADRARARADEHLRDVTPRAEPRRDTPPRS